MRSGKEKVDRINQLRSEVARLNEFIPQIDNFSHVTLGIRTSKKDPFYKQTEKSKFYSGRTLMLDVPDDIDIIGYIKDKTMELYESKTKELKKLYGEL